MVLTKDARSSDKLMHGIKVLMAKNYIDNLSEEVRKGVRTKAAQGLWPSFAPLGYVNTSSSDGKKIIVPDPIPWVGGSRPARIRSTRLRRKRMLKDSGFARVARASRKNTLNKVLRKRIYTGEFEYGGGGVPRNSRAARHARDLGARAADR